MCSVQDAAYTKLMIKPTRKRNYQNVHKMNNKIINCKVVNNNK